MNADTYDLKTILTLERRYAIPTFQRDYEWTEDGQWALLFDDLEAVVDRLETARHTAEVLGEPITKADKKVAPHFLGAIVLDMLPSSAGSIDLRSVIDGQQRITTIQLLIRGVLDVLIELDSPRTKQVRRLIQNPADVVQNDDERHKLWPRRRDRDVWRVAMAEEAPKAGDHLYLKARKYFSDRARVAIGGGGGPDRSDLVVDSLISLFKIVVIDLEDNDDAQVIFEVLNGRQTPLSATDLVKNLLFLRAELVDEAELEELYDEHWAHFDDEWWRKEIGRGHAARGRRDVLLSSWLAGAAGTEVNVGHLYGEVRHYLDDGDHKIVDILTELSAAAGAFRTIFDPPKTLPKKMRRAYQRIVGLGVVSTLPLLVWLRTLPEDVLSEDEQVRAVTAVDSWVMRRLIVGANTRNYAKHFIDVLKAAREAAEHGKPVADAVHDSLLDPGPDSMEWPSDEDVEWAFVNRTFYGNVVQARIRMILGAIDRQLHEDHPKGEHPTFNYDELQIEHLLPASWRKNWPVQAATDAEQLLLEQERDRVKNRLGNLTLITGDLNLPLGHDSWADKRPEIAKHSNLQLNVGLAEHDTWDESTIEQRAKDLAAVACRVWPR